MSKVPIKLLYEGDGSKLYPLTALEAVRLPDEFEVVGVNVGNLKDGDKISAGSSVLDILTRMLKQRIQPSVTQPSVSISGGGGDVEVGTSVSGKIITSSFADGYFTLNKDRTDAGCQITKFILKQTIGKTTTTVIDSDSISSYSVPQNTYVTEGSGAVKYQNIITYGSNTVIPKDNFGDDATVKINGSSKSATTQWNGKYRCYVGFDQGDSIVATPEVVKSIKNVNNNLMPNTSGATTTWSIVTNNAYRIMIAYPSNMKDISQIELTTEPGSHYEVNFTKELVDVSGVNDLYPREYKVYTWVLSAPSSGDTFNVKL